jgi:hypothetical protein
LLDSWLDSLLDSWLDSWPDSWLADDPNDAKMCSNPGGPLNDGVN